MHSGFPGLGTLVNIATIVLGSFAGMLIGHRLDDRTRGVVTDCLGLVTLLAAASSAMMITDPALTKAVGSGAPMLIVLGALLIGSITGSLLRIEDRLEGLAGLIEGRVGRRAPGRGDRDDDTDSRDRFIEGWMTASLLFCVGPLTILGSIDDGMGRGIDKLALKSVLDGFAAMAFASTFGLGVLMSVVSVAIVQGSLTAVGVLLGAVLPDAHIAALTATGGLMLVAIALRLLNIRQIPVGDMLPALIVAPLLTALVIVFR